MCIKKSQTINSTNDKYVCIMGYYSDIKKNKILPFVTTWMDLEGIMLTWSKSGGERQMLWFHTYVESIKQTNKQNQTLR